MDVAGIEPYTAALFLLYGNIVFLSLLPHRDGTAWLFRPLILASGALPAALAILWGVYLKLDSAASAFGDDLLGAGLILEVGSIQLLLAGERLFPAPQPAAPDSPYPSRCR